MGLFDDLPDAGGTAVADKPAAQAAGLFDDLPNAAPSQAAPQSGLFDDLPIARKLGQDEIDNSIAQQAIENNPANTAKLSEGVGKALESASQKIEELSPGFLQQFTTSPLPSPNLPPDPNDSRLEAARKAIINSVGGLVEGVSSPAMVAGVGAGAAVPAVGKALATGFGLDMARGVPEQVNKAITGPTFQEQLEGGLGAASQIMMAHAALKHGLSSPEARAAIEKEIPKVVPEQGQTPQPQDFGPVNKEPATPVDTAPLPAQEGVVPQMAPQNQQMLPSDLPKGNSQDVSTRTDQAQQEVSPAPAEAASKNRVDNQTVSSEISANESSIPATGSDTSGRSADTGGNQSAAPDDLRRSLETNAKFPEGSPERFAGEQSAGGSVELAQKAGASDAPDFRPSPTKTPEVFPGRDTISTSSDAGKPDVAAAEPRTTGIAQRVHDARAEAGKIGEIQPGTGLGAQEIMERGRADLAAGVDPVARMAELEAAKAPASARDIGLFRAELERRSKITDQADQAARANPESLNAKKAYNDAFKAETDFAKQIKPFSTEASDVFRAHQGETNIDTGTFTGLRRAFMEEHGRDVKPSEAQRLQEAADKVSEKTKQLQKSLDSLSKIGDRELKKFKPKTSEEIRQYFADKMDKKLPCA